MRISYLQEDPGFISGNGGIPIERLIPPLIFPGN
jgi:hypothetical protein